MENIKTLWMAYIQRTASDERKKGLLAALGSYAEQYYRRLPALLHALDKGESYEDKEQELHLIFAEESEGKVSLIYSMQSAEYQTVELRRDIIAMLDLFTPILPLGSVVSLHHEKEEEEDLLAVITHRFLNTQGEDLYIPYGAAPYPMGMQGTGKFLYAVQSAIKEVVWKGYAEEKEQQYVREMKQQLLVEEQKCSLEFADAAQKEHVKQMLGGEYKWIIMSKSTRAH